VILEILQPPDAGDEAMMAGGGHPDLGLNVDLAGDEIEFSFVNGQVADEFALLNGQSVGD